MRSKWAERFGNGIVVAIATIVCSFALTRFSGTALVFPETWREIVFATGMATGVVAFELGNFIRERREHKESASKANHGEDKKRGSLVLIIAQVFLALLLIAAVSGFFFLRAKCVRDFNPTLWVANQAKRDAYLVSSRPKTDDDIKRSSTQPSQEDLQLNKAMEEAAKDATDKSKAMAHGGQEAELAKSRFAAETSDASQSNATTHADSVAAAGAVVDSPEFLDIRSHRIYLPLHFPPDHVEYIQSKQIDGQDGIAQILDTQPELMFNWLNGDTKIYLARTTLLFLWNYLAIICVAGLLAGIRLNIVGSLVEMFV